jgi:hypothetical protein
MASSKEIEREVETQRANVESTLDALKHKMSLGQIVDEVGGYFGAEEARRAMQNAGRQVRDNPVALGLVGVGLAWLIFGRSDAGRRDWAEGYDDGYGYGYRRDGDRAAHAGAQDYPGGARYGSVYGTPYEEADRGRESDGSTLQRAARSVSEAAAGVRERVSHAASGVVEAISGARDAGRRRAHEIGEAVASHAPSAGELSRRGERVKSALAEAMERQPLMVGAFAVAAGAAIGAALPATRAESRLLGEARDGLMDEARRAASGLRETAVEAAEAGLAAAAETARREGLIPEGDGRTLAQRVEATVRAGVEGAKERVEEDAGATARV